MAFMIYLALQVFENFFHLRKKHIPLNGKGFPLLSLNIYIYIYMLIYIYIYIYMEELGSII